MRALLSVSESCLWDSRDSVVFLFSTAAEACPMLDGTAVPELASSSAPEYSRFPWASVSLYTKLSQPSPHESSSCWLRFLLRPMLGLDATGRRRLRRLGGDGCRCACDRPDREEEIFCQ